MQTRKLGKSGLEVSVLCLGTMTFGNQADKTESHNILSKAFDAGVYFIDTADVYPLGGTWEQLGRTEETIGEWLRGKRHEVVLATKCFGQMSNNPNAKGLGRKHIFDAVDASLRRLGTDYIDLYQAHQFDFDVPMEETLRAFDDLVREGKVRYVGVSNWRAWQVAKALGISRHFQYDPIQSVQPRYNLLFRMIEEELVPLCQSEGVGVITYNPLAGGMLTGRYQRGQEVETATRFSLGGIGLGAGKMYQERYWNQAVFEAVEHYRQWCAEQGRNMVTTAVQWVISQPGTTSAIIGASRVSQLDDSLRAVEAQPLSADELKALDELWFQLPKRKEFR